ncbi:MAG: RidA family protein [Alphaproteobacteria bacterium]|nr:RidA family protein [Alphaproteobacteria bacterium]
MDIRKKLEELGYELPQVAAPAANYVPYIIEGGMVFISGQIPFLNGQSMHLGRVGDDLTLEQGIEAARACALNILAQADAAVSGDWSKIKRCVKLGGFVNCTPDFTDHPKVINGASDLIGEVLGEAGKHTRFAVGASSLPLGVAVEIEAIFTLKA